MLGTEELDLPPTVLITRAFWYVVEPELLAAAGLAPADWPGTLHAAEHAAIGMLPLFTICDRWDVGGVSTALQADTGRPTIVIYDGYAGGAGIAELGFEAADRHLRATLEVIESCPCERRLPVVRAVAEVRQRQRAARQGRAPPRSAARPSSSRADRRARRADAAPPGADRPRTRVDPHGRSHDASR